MTTLIDGPVSLPWSIAAALLGLWLMLPPGTARRAAHELTAWNTRRTFRSRLRAYQRARAALARTNIPED
jgi:hypothetical protein